MNVQFQLPNQWFRSGAYLEGELCHAPLLTLPFSTKEQNYWCQVVTEMCQTLLMVSVANGQERIQGGMMRGMHFPTSHSQKCF